MSAYRYLVNNIEVQPLQEPESIKYERELSSLGFSQDIEGDLLFRSNDPSFDFTAQNICEEITFEIEQLCSGVWTSIYTGTFEPREGEFDNDRCTFKVKPRKTGSLQTNIKVNLLEVRDRVKGSVTTGVVDLYPTFPNTYVDCVWLKDALLLLAQKGNANITSVVSNFFQINPTAGFPLSTPSNYEDLALTPISNVQNPVPSNIALIEYITLEELMADLNVMFDVFWFVDGTSFRIEHSTFFSGSPVIDLTDSQYASFMRGTNKYKYNLRDLPQEELWEYVGHRQKTKVVYHGLSSIGSTKTEKRYNTTKLYTDFLNVLTSNFLDGFFLFATDGGAATGGNEIRMLSFENRELWPDTLVRNVCTYNRPSLYGYVVSGINYWELDVLKNYDVQTLTLTGGKIFDTVRPVKRQKDLNFPLCCADFDGKKKITSQLGDGVVSSAEYKLSSRMFKISLDHETDVCPVRTPTDIGDLALWLKFNTGVTHSGGLVSQWDDQSGNARHAAQATSANRPVRNADFSINFNDNTWDVVNLADPPNQTWFTTPAFTLFPSKRGTIVLVMQGDHTNMVLSPSPGSGFGMACLSTNDGGASTYFDICMDEISEYMSLNFGLVYYPRNGVKRKASQGPTGVYIFRRVSDTLMFCRHNSLNCFNNPLVIANTQPSSLPLVVGRNAHTYGNNGRGLWNIAELQIYDRELTDAECEEVELELVKRDVYTKTYPLS